MTEEKAQDKELQCIECQEIFLFTSGEQKFYSSKNLSPPKRCPACRYKRKQTIVKDGNLE